MTGPAPSRVAPWYDRLARYEKTTAILQLVQALADLLGIRAPLIDTGDDTFVDVQHSISQKVAASVPPSEVPLVEPLVGIFITRKPDTFIEAVSTMVLETAEILFLPRKARREYLALEGKTAPYLINKLMLEYALLARHLDTLMGVLNKTLCKTACPDPPVGCCRHLGYDLGLIPDRMLIAQAIEATRYGWRPPPNPDLEKCRYHTDSGCALRLLKSPACIGAMCNAVEADLNRRFPEALLNRFRTAMENFRNSDIDRERVFANMKALIHAGDSLIRVGEPQ
jgi:hypothetical protein